MAVKNIPIWFTFDNKYVEPAAVAFYSLLNKTKDGMFWDMYVLHSDITEEKQKLLQDVVGRFKNAKLSFIDTKDFLKDEWKEGNYDGHNQRTQFCRETILKCFPMSFFPQYDKIIYSDVDVIFTDDISELWDVDLADNYLAAVKSPFMKYSNDEFSHMKPEHYEQLKDSYFAGGIWVMNLKKVREDNIEQRMWDIMKDDTIIKRWPDQDIMNIAFLGKVTFLPLNYISYPYMAELLRKPQFQSHYTREELYDSLINPKIIHFANAKPWNNAPKYSNLWWTFFDYLGLEKTKIFKDYNPQTEKMKKYKKRCGILEIVCVVLVMIAVWLVIRGL